MTREVAICFFCKSKLQVKGKKCMAFPEEIPDEIFIGPNNHDKPYFNDNNIQFELDPTKKDLYKRWLELQKT